MSVDLDGFAPDVIVVGAGSAGCALTRRLIDAGVSVLLLEAGGPDDSPAIHDPARFHELWLAPEDWAYYTTPQAAAADRSLHWPRGKVLGGSSCLNGLIHVRGARTDYDEWVRLGAEGWGWDDVLPAFVRMEDFDGGSSAVHGSGGPLHILSDYELAPLHESIMAAAQEIGIAHNPDYNGRRAGWRGPDAAHHPRRPARQRRRGLPAAGARRHQPARPHRGPCPSPAARGHALRRRRVRPRRRPAPGSGRPGGRRQRGRDRVPGAAAAVGYRAGGRSAGAGDRRGRRPPRRRREPP